MELKDTSGYASDMRSKAKRLFMRGGIRKDSWRVLAIADLIKSDSKKIAELKRARLKMVMITGGYPNNCTSGEKIC